MAAIKMSSNYEILIPSEIGRTLDIQPGQELEVVVLDGIMELVPVLPIESLSGICKGMDTTVVRDSDRV